MHFKKSVECVGLPAVDNQNDTCFMSQLAGCGELKMESTFIRPSPLFETTAGSGNAF